MSLPGASSPGLLKDTYETPVVYLCCAESERPVDKATLRNALSGL